MTDEAGMHPDLVGPAGGGPDRDADGIPEDLYRCKLGDDGLTGFVCPDPAWSALIRMISALLFFLLGCDILSNDITIFLLYISDKTTNIMYLRSSPVIHHENID